MSVTAPSVPQLIKCIRDSQGLSLQEIANFTDVGEPTVWRWENEDANPTHQHREMLRALHDRDFCEHTDFEYICDHPDLEDTLGPVQNPPLTDLIQLSQLRQLRSINDAPDMSSTEDSQAGREIGKAPSNPDSDSVTKIVYIVRSSHLPHGSRSKSYRGRRTGAAPIFIIVVRDEHDAAREFLDHVLQQSLTKSLPFFRSTKAIKLVRPKSKRNPLPRATKNRRTGK